MTLTLAEWDAKIAPRLHGIEDGADRIARHVDKLIWRPDFHTFAYDDLRRIEDILERALDRVRKAKRDYQEKPTGA